MALISQAQIAVFIADERFYQNEIDVLINCQKFKQSGEEHVKFISEKLSALKDEIILSPSAVFNAVKEEKLKIEGMLFEFDRIYASLCMTSECAMLTRKQCQTKLDKVLAEKNSLFLQWQKLEENLIKQLEKLERCEKTCREAKNNFVRTKKKMNKRFCRCVSCYCAMPLFMLAGVLILVVLQIYFNAVNTLLDLFLFAVVFSAFTCGAAKDLQKEYSKTKKAMKNADIALDNILKQIKSETEERDRLASNFQKTTIKYEMALDNYEIQIYKTDAFAEVIKVLTHFQVFLKKWQNVLDEFLNIYKAKCSSSTNLPKLISEREEKSFIKKLLTVLNKEMPVMIQLE